MGVISEVLGNHGSPHTIEWNGKKYSFSLIDQRVKSAFEKNRLAKAKEALALVKDIMSPEEYSLRLGEIIQQYRDGEFEIFSEHGLAFIQTSPGMRLLLSLLASCDEQELVGLILAKEQQLVELLRLIINESFPGLSVPAPETAASDAAAAPPITTASAPDPNVQQPAA